jgi:hypothetical protein
LYGYGNLTIGGRTRMAHVLSYELHHGPVPEGLCVLHSCDNPPCTNPAHLSAGTRAENNRQRMERNRYRPLRGMANPNALVRDIDVLAIRALDVTGRLKQREIAALFGISQLTVSNIVTRRSWKHLP